MTIAYIQGSRENLVEIVAINQEIFKEMYDNEPYSIEAYKQRLYGKESIIMIVTDDKKIIGNAIIYHQDEEWYLWIMGISREYQNKGIGSRLLEEVKKRVKERKGKVITVKVYSVSKAMHHLIQKKGYMLTKKKNNTTYYTYNMLK